MSNEPKDTKSIQAEIAKEYRNMKSRPGLEIGLRPEQGTFELCDKHYDASRTESEEHCAVCKLEKQLTAVTAEKNALAEEVHYLRLYGNKDCTAQADYELDTARKAALAQDKD